MTRACTQTASAIAAHILSFCSTLPVSSLLAMRHDAAVSLSAPNRVYSSARVVCGAASGEDTESGPTDGDELSARLELFFCSVPEEEGNAPPPPGAGAPPGAEVEAADGDEEDDHALPLFDDTIDENALLPDPANKASRSTVFCSRA